MGGEGGALICFSLLSGLSFLQFLWFICIDCNKLFYYKNTNEIPCELSHENTISFL